MELTKDGNEYVLRFKNADFPDGRLAEDWCGIAALHWLSVMVGNPIPQEVIAQKIGFDPKDGTDEDQIIWGLREIGLYSGP